MEFSDKVIAVTGGSKGIGKGIALAFAEHGAKIVISARGQADLDAAALEIEAAGGQALTVVCDVTDRQQISEFADTVFSQYGQVDVLVNNAGMAASHKFIDYPDELWDQVIATNLTSVFLMSKAFAKNMIHNNSGRIINIASAAGKKADHFMAAYSSSKHGVIGLTRNMAVELNSNNITVNAICPGYVDTPMVDWVIQKTAEKTNMSKEQAQRYLQKSTPQNRLFEVEEVVHVALMLASEKAKGITGQAISIDGGVTMI